jgi:predicted DNA-binding WGR domain protein/predicted RNA-binding Zn-ribbon protein involved in translation (DUF1610 family)
MRVITKVKAAVRRARARVVDAEAVKCWECGERFPSDTKVYPFHQKMDGKKCPMSNKKVKGFEAEDTLTPVPVSPGSSGKALAIAKHNAGVTRSQDGAAYEWKCPHCGQVFTADDKNALEDRGESHLVRRHQDESTDIKVKKGATDTSPVRRVRDNARGMTSTELRDEIRAVKAQISGASGIALKRERPERYAELEKRLDELLDASSYRAKDTSPVRRVRDANADAYQEGAHVLYAGKPCIVIHMYADTVDLKTQEGYKLLGVKMSKLKPDYGKAKDTSPVFNLSPVPMPEDEHGRGRYAQAWGEDSQPNDPWRKCTSCGQKTTRVICPKCGERPTKVEDALTPIPMEDAEFTTRCQPNPNPNPRSITSLALPTPVDVSNAYQPRSKEQLSKSFGKDGEEKQTKYFSATNMHNSADAHKAAEKFLEEKRKTGYAGYQSAHGEYGFSVTFWKKTQATDALRGLTPVRDYHADNDDEREMTPTLRAKAQQMYRDGIAQPKIADKLKLSIYDVDAAVQGLKFGKAKDSDNDQLAKNLTLNVSELTKLIAKVRASLDNNDWGSYHIPNVQANLKKLEAEKADVEARLRSMGRAKDSSSAFFQPGDTVYIVGTPLAGHEGKVVSVEKPIGGDNMYRVSVNGHIGGFPERSLEEKSAARRTMGAFKLGKANDADGFKVGDKVMRGSDGPYKVVRVNENGSVEIQSIVNYGHRQEPVSILSEEKAQRSLTKATDALRGLTPVGV